MPPVLVVFLDVSAALVGATVGSFLNVCIYRLPRPGLRIDRPVRSFCPTCGEQIAWYDNIPVLSWIRLGGRCRACKSSISVRYLLVEALTAALFALVVHRYVVQEGGSWGGCLVLLALVAGLMVATFVDIDLRLIPDEITLGGMHLLPLAVLLFPDLHSRSVDGLLSRALTAVQPFFVAAHSRLPEALTEGPFLWGTVAAAAAACFAAGFFLYRVYRRRFLPEMSCRFRDLSLAGLLSAAAGGGLAVEMLRPELTFSPRVYALWATLLGMLAGSGLVFLVGAVGTRLFRKPAMGFGDVKLMGLLGGICGWQGAVAGFFLASFLGSIFGVFRLVLYRDRYLPFGPFLAAGCFLLVLWPEALDRAMSWYLGLFRP